MDTTSVILAVASPPGRSARGIVRLSGPGALELVGRGLGGTRGLAGREPAGVRDSLPGMAKPTVLRIHVSERIGQVSGLLQGRCATWGSSD